MVRGARAAIVPLPLVIVLLSCSRGVTTRESTASAPSDTDLVAGPCPALSTPAGLLPAQIPQFVSLWPRDGHRIVDGRCETVHRRTIVDHSGLILSLSLVVSEAAPPAESLGFRAGHALAPAVLRAGVDPARPMLVVELAAAPGTSEESLRSDLELVLERLRPLGVGAETQGAAAASPTGQAVAPEGAASPGMK